MKAHLANNEAEAWAQINELDRCINCIHLINRDLFGGTCIGPESGFKSRTENSEGCECFRAADKETAYWIYKLVGMALEYNGNNDFMRRLAYHQANGTDHQFLFG